MDILRKFIVNRLIIAILITFLKEYYIPLFIYRIFINSHAFLYFLLSQKTRMFCIRLYCLDNFESVFSLLQYFKMSFHIQKSILMFDIYHNGLDNLHKKLLFCIDCKNHFDIKLLRSSSIFLQFY